MIKVGGYIKKLSYVCVVMLLILIRLPAAFSLSDNVIVRGILLFLITIFIFLIFLWHLYQGETHFLIKRWGLVAIAYACFLLLSIIQAIFRNSTDIVRIIGNFSVPTLSVIFCVLVCSMLSENEVWHFQAAIFWMIFVYILLNFLLWVTGIYNRPEIFIEPRSSILLSYLGIKFYRVTFPMATGINSFGYTAGMILVSGLILMFKSHCWTKYLGVFSILMGLITIALVDARAALFFSAVAFALSLLTIKPSRSWWIIALSMGIPILFLFVLDNLPDNWISLISRSGEDALTLSNRTFVWQRAFDVLSPFQIHHLIGWGYRGQIPSGIMGTYVMLFSNYQNITTIPLHNSFLQYIIEIGYVGLIVFVMLLFFLLKEISRQTLYSSSPWGLVMKGLVIYLVISSSFDSVLSLDSQETFTVFLMIVSNAVVHRSALSKSKS